MINDCCVLFFISKFYPMKTLKIFSLPKFSLFMSLLLITAACDLETDTPEPDYEGQVKQLLPRVQRNIAFMLSTDMVRFQSIWMQQLAGVRGIPESADRYEPENIHMDDSWNLYYNNIFFQLKDLEYYVNELESQSFRGISRILEAYTLLIMTDNWGEIPYSQAPDYLISGVWPEYDQQEDILEDILTLLTTGISDLESADPNASFAPGPESDHLYAGHLNQWIRAANLFRLRVLLRLANYHQDYSNLLQEITEMDLYSSSGQNLYYPFDGSAQNSNPHYVYDYHVRNTRVGKFFVDLLKENDDPRLTQLVRINTSNEYVGSAPGQSLYGASFIGPSLASPASPLVIASFAEVLFIKAEIYYRNNQQAMADQAFEQAVKASLDFHQVEDPEWEAEYAEVENVSLEQIMNAKYIALFLQPEVWSDFRRTGYPQITPYEPEEHHIPRRQIYPVTEIQNNTENVPLDITIFDRVWWDHENHD